jgi:hypothetical protein
MAFHTSQAKSTTGRQREDARQADPKCCSDRDGGNNSGETEPGNPGKARKIKVEARRLPALTTRALVICAAPFRRG